MDDVNSVSIPPLLRPDWMQTEERYHVAVALRPRERESERFDESGITVDYDGVVSTDGRKRAFDRRIETTFGTPSAVMLRFADEPSPFDAPNVKTDDTAKVVGRTSHKRSHRPVSRLRIDSG